MPRRRGTTDAVDGKPHSIDATLAVEWNSAVQMQSMGSTGRMEMVRFPC